MGWYEEAFWSNAGKDFDPGNCGVLEPIDSLLADVKLELEDDFNELEEQHESVGRDLWETDARWVSTTFFNHALITTLTASSRLWTSPVIANFGRKLTVFFWRRWIAIDLWVRIIIVILIYIWDCNSWIMWKHESRGEWWFSIATDSRPVPNHYRILNLLLLDVLASEIKLN
jgi:hypothetical protein